jgi:hypothetical protein
VIFLHAECGFSRVVSVLVWHLHSACRNHTLRVEITVLSVVITFLRVKITLRLEITLYVKKLHHVFRHHTLRVAITLYVKKLHHVFRHHTLRVAITLCV